VEGGGRWSDELSSDTTFLIADSLAQTKKIGVALTHSIPIVRSAFAEDPFRFEMLNWWCISPVRFPLFTGITFSIHRRVPNLEALQEAILAHSGVIGNNPTHVILPHGIPNPFPSSIAVTIYWIWACIECQKILPLDASVMFAPLSYTAPIQNVVGLVFCLANLDIETKNQLADMVRFVGGRVVYKMSGSLHFVVATTLKKIAVDLRVPIVNPNFVVEMVRCGALPNPSSFKLDAVVKSKMLQRLCKCITGAPIAKPSEISVECERIDLEKFTQEFNSTQDEVSLEVKYDSGHAPPHQENAISADPLIVLMNRRS
jgi:hypothetical protein